MAYVRTDKTVLASAGMQADAVTLRKVLAWKIIMYRHKHGKVRRTHAQEGGRAQQRSGNDGSG